MTMKLNMRQMREVGKALGGTPEEWQNDPFGLQAAMAWQKKVADGDKDFTFEQALDLSMEEVAEILGLDAEGNAAPLEK